MTDSRSAIAAPPPQANTAPLISVVIPIKNGSDTLKACLDGIFAQTVRGQMEVVVIDSGSTDGSVALLKQHPVELTTIPPGEFNHGDTRNLAVKLARGQFVVMTVQDAVPAGPRWIEMMLQHFSDPLVMGVCGQQIVPHDPDKNPLGWFRPCSEPTPTRVGFPQPGEFSRLGAAEQWELSGWDNVTAMYRKPALVELPFRRVSFCEDALWARDALSRGQVLVYEPRAQVVHYHNESFSFRFRRVFTQQYHFHRHFGHRPAGKPLLPSLARAVYHLGRWKEVPWGRKPKWLWYNFRLITADWSARRWLSLLYHVRGDAAVERMHERLCGRAPQPLRQATPAAQN